ncbi:MAG: DUF6868 family protein [Gammaproteobacteria bacterium]
MNIELLQDFFFWCMLVNIGIYAFTAIAVLLLRGVVCKIHKKMFGMDEQTALASVQHYLATYKLLITVFNFVPWIAIFIIK